jgi:aldehyde dehydrogenase (NAD+)
VGLERDDRGGVRGCHDLEAIGENARIGNRLFQADREQVLLEENIPEGVMNLVIGDTAEVGEPLLADSRVQLVSATGSTRMGKRVAEVVGQRLGRTLLELSGNKAIILTEHADLKIAIPSIVFGAVGTASQRCTATRRLIVHDSIYEQVKAALISAYKALKIGNPLNETNHVGPLIDKQAVAAMRAALDAAVAQGGRVLFGGEILEGPEFASGCYIRPALVEARNQMPIVQQETFAPILYVIRYNGEVEAGIAIQNDVPQGLSSALFSRLGRDSEVFLSSGGSDCGIANVNIGTSGAEIGGAFGGDKETGGGRELGSDCWKAYMRRQTCTVNYGQEPPTLAQGITFRSGINERKGQENGNKFKPRTDERVRPESL